MRVSIYSARVKWDKTRWNEMSDEIREMKEEEDFRSFQRKKAWILLWGRGGPEGLLIKGQGYWDHVALISRSI